MSLFIPCLSLSLLCQSLLALKCAQGRVKRDGQPLFPDGKGCVVKNTRKNGSPVKGDFIPPPVLEDQDERADALPQQEEFWKPPTRFGARFHAVLAAAGSSAERKVSAIEVSRSNPALPSIFDYVLFSQGDLTTQ